MNPFLNSTRKKRLTGKLFIRLGIIFFIVSCANQKPAPKKVNLYREKPSVLIAQGDREFAIRNYRESFHFFKRANALKEEKDTLLDLKILVSRYGDIVKSPKVPFGSKEFDSLTEKSSGELDDLMSDDQFLKRSFLKIRFCREANLAAQKIDQSIRCDIEVYSDIEEEIESISRPDPKTLEIARIELAKAYEERGRLDMAKSMFQTNLSSLTPTEKSFYSRLIETDSLKIRTRFRDLISIKEVTRADMSYILAQKLEKLSRFAVRHSETKWNDIESHNMRKSLNWMVNMGLFFPEYKPGYFEPDRPVTRRELAIIFYNLSEIARRAGTKLPQVLAGETNVNSHWIDLKKEDPSHNYLVAAVLNGIIRSSGEKIFPLNPVSGPELIRSVETFEELIK